MSEQVSEVQRLEALLRQQEEECRRVEQGKRATQAALQKAKASTTLASPVELAPAPSSYQASGLTSANNHARPQTTTRHRATGMAMNSGFPSPSTPQQMVRHFSTSLEDDRV